MQTGLALALNLLNVSQTAVIKESCMVPDQSEFVRPASVMKVTESRTGMDGHFFTAASAAKEVDL